MTNHSQDSMTARPARADQYGDWGNPCFTAYTGPVELWRLHVQNCRRCARFEAKQPKAPEPPAPREPLGITSYAEPNRVRRDR